MALVEVSFSPILSRTIFCSCCIINGILITNNCLYMIDNRHVISYRLLNITTIDICWILLLFLGLLTCCKFTYHRSNTNTCWNCSLLCTHFKPLCITSFAYIKRTPFFIHISDWVFVVVKNMIVIFTFSNFAFNFYWWLLVLIPLRSNCLTYVLSHSMTEIKS